jgi:gliding motility-associated-like protein
MKFIHIRTFALLFCGFMFTQTVFSQTFTYSNTLTPTELVENILIGSGVTSSNITFNGSAINAGSPQVPAQSFTATAPFPFAAGVYLKTGGAPGISDPDLSAIASGNPTNGAILEFDFVATGDSLVFNYVFASSEYTGYTCSGFNDAFGFFLSGPGITGPYASGAVNLALVPGGNIPVTINTVNSGVPSGGNPGPCAALDPNWTANSIYFTTSFGNFSGQFYNGSTVAMTALSGLVCGATYHIKLAICNVLDQALDSGVFLEANSFSSNAVAIEAQSTIFGGSFTDTVLAEGCTSTNLLLIRPEWTIDTTQTFTITYSGTASAAADFTNLNGTVTFPIGVDTLIYNIVPIADGLTEPMEWIQILGYTISVCGDTLYDSLTLYVVDRYELTFDMVDTVTASCAPNQAQVTIYNFQGSIPSYDILWDFGDTTNPVLMPDNGSLPGVITYLVTVTDGCGEEFYDSVTVIYNVTLPEIAILPNDTIYVDCIPDSALASVVLTTGAPGPFTYQWSNGSTNDSTYFFDNGVNGSAIPFLVTVTDGCSNQAIKSGVLIVNQTLAVDTLISSPSNFCDPTGFVSGFITGETSATGNIQYSWTGPNGSPNTVASSVWTNKPSGWYYFTATDDVCSVSDSVFIGIQNAPVAQMAANPSTGTAPLWVILSNTSQNASTYYWDFGNGQTATTNNLANTAALYNEPGVYTVMLIASQGNNCNDTTYLTIIVNPPPVIPPVFPPIWEIPNVFSPNGDQINDLWFIETTNIYEIDLTILNRWGNVMYQGKGPLPAWNGDSPGGTEAEDGVYFYKFILYADDGSEIPGQGFLHLTR